MPFSSIIHHYFNNFKYIFKIYVIAVSCFCDMLRRGLIKYGVKYTKFLKKIDIGGIIRYNKMRYSIGNQRIFSMHRINYSIFNRLNIERNGIV